MSSVSTAKMTARQYQQLGEDPPGVRLELVQGEIAVAPSPTPDHAYSVGKLYRLLDEYVEQHDLGQVLCDVDTLLSEYDVRRPDVLYVAKQRLSIVTSTAVAAVPDLCVEVVSPTSARIDRQDKYQQYQRAGLPHYWIVDPARRTIECYSLRGDRFVLTDSASGSATAHFAPFPDLAIPLARLWRSS